MEQTPTPTQQAQAVHFLDQLVQAARQAPGRRLEITDNSTGAIVATVQAYEVQARPRDMPRALRPKQRLSKRQRDAAKRSKMGLPPMTK